MTNFLDIKDLLFLCQILGSFCEIEGNVQRVAGRFGLEGQTVDRHGQSDRQEPAEGPGVLWPDGELWQVCSTTFSPMSSWTQSLVSGLTDGLYCHNTERTMRLENATWFIVGWSRECLHPVVFARLIRFLNINSLRLHSKAMRQRCLKAIETSLNWIFFYILKPGSKYVFELFSAEGAATYRCNTKQLRHAAYLRRR